LSCTKSDASVVLFKKNNTRLNEYWTDNYAGIGIWHMMHLIQRHCWRTWDHDDVVVKDNDDAYGNCYAGYSGTVTGLATSKSDTESSWVIKTDGSNFWAGKPGIWTSVEQKSDTAWATHARKKSAAYRFNSSVVTYYTCKFFGKAIYNDTGAELCPDLNAFTGETTIHEFDPNGITAFSAANSYAVVAQVTVSSFGASDYTEDVFIDENDFPNWVVTNPVLDNNMRVRGFVIDTTDMWALVDWEFDI